MMNRSSATLNLRNEEREEAFKLQSPSRRIKTRATLGGRQPQPLHVPRPDDREVPPVRGQYGTRVQPLRHRDHRRVHEAKGEVSVVLHQLRAPIEIARLEGFDRELADRHRPHEACLGLDPLAPLNQIRDLGQDGDGDHHLARARLPPAPYPLVPGIAAVQEGVHRAGIGDGGQSCGSRQRSSSTRSDVSVCPLSNRILHTQGRCYLPSPPHFSPYRPTAVPPIFPSSSQAELSPMKTQGSNKDVVFLSGVRTGCGTFGGSLKDHSATALGAIAARCALERSAVPPDAIGHTVFGNALQTSPDAIYCARHIGLKAGLPIEVPAVTVNRLCGSGFEAITQGAQLILLGEAEAVLAGGAESMSQAPHVVRGARWGLRLGPSAPLEDLLWEALKDPQCGLSMAETAENLADKYKLTRKEVDEVALGSQQRAKQAWDACVFQDEVVGIPTKKKGQQVEFRADEHMRPETTLEVLGSLKSYFKKDGLVTAGNASGISDGAAATVIASDEYAKAHGLKPLGRLVAWAVVGVEPKYMGIGPAPAARKALQKAAMKLEQMDLMEVNEAFAPQYLAVERELGLDRAKTNVHGGAIAIGHPLAASGTRITIHLLHALRQQKKRFGLGSACIGGGQGAAVIVEAFPA